MDISRKFKKLKLLRSSQQLKLCRELSRVGKCFSEFLRRFQIKSHLTIIKLISVMIKQI